MGFIMEDQGDVTIEARRDSFVLIHRADWHNEHRYDNLEIGYEDVPDVIAALVLLIDREHIVTGFEINEYKKVGKRLEREKEIVAISQRGEFENV